MSAPSPNVTLIIERPANQGGELRLYLEGQDELNLHPEIKPIAREIFEQIPQQHAMKLEGRAAAFSTSYLPLALFHLRESFTYGQAQEGTFDPTGFKKQNCDSRFSPKINYHIGQIEEQLKESGIQFSWIEKAQIPRTTPDKVISVPKEARKDSPPESPLAKPLSGMGDIPAGKNS